MNLTLSLLLPLAVGHGHGPTPVGPVGPSCATGQCAPASAPYGPTLPRFTGPYNTLPPSPGVRQVCPPNGPPAPTLTSIILAPQGSMVTFYNGGTGRVFPAPVTAGFRPGYIYRFELSNLPGHPGEALYPILEVRGSLVPRATMKPSDFPAPIVISRDDIEKALTGVMVTKFIYLENPEKASPAPSRPNDPLEVNDFNEEAASDAAQENGRLVAVLRFGDRRPEREELTRSGVAGTMLLPGENYLGAPAVGPCLPWNGVQMYDPILGPKPMTEECFTDGGDKGPRLGIGPNGRIGGLNPTDVAVEYSQGGVRRVSTSNEVCICVPRYAVRRVDLGLARLLRTTGLDAVKQSTGRSIVSTRTPAQGVINREKPVGFDGRMRAAEQIGRQFADVAASVQKIAVSGTAQGVLVVGSHVGPDEITSFPNQLLVTKEVDPAGSHKIGDEVTFTIRYRNGTRHPVSEIVVSDSLSGRLEYIPGSAASDRPANVTTSENEAGSVIVRFELPGELGAGQGGVVKFRAKIR